MASIRCKFIGFKVSGLNCFRSVLCNFVVAFVVAGKLLLLLLPLLVLVLVLLTLMLLLLLVVVLLRVLVVVVVVAKPETPDPSQDRTSCS